MSGFPAVAGRAARGWVAAYTLGLASSVRDARRAEIASDVWEQHADGVSAGRSAIEVAADIFSRVTRGVPADLLWRVNVEGPQMDIRIPFERVVGGVLLGLVVLMMITASISGYDTSVEGFDGELRRLANISDTADSFNAVFRVLTGVALIGGAAALYATLKERSGTLAAMAAFGVCTAGILVLAANAMQMTFVALADEYVASSGARQEQLLVTARGFGVASQEVATSAFIALMLGTWALAILVGREALVPRWLVGIPVMGGALIVAALIAALFGADDMGWLGFVAGVLTSALWLLIAGLWLLIGKPEPRVAAPPVAPAAA